MSILPLEGKYFPSESLIRIQIALAVLSPRVISAVRFMQEAHRAIDQRRKDNVRPYEVHPLDVFIRLIEAGVENEDVLIAALFHDILEDVQVKMPCLPREVARLFNLDLEFNHSWAEAIDFLFGSRVLYFVVQLTDLYTKENYPDLNRRERKQLQREHYGTFCLDVMLIKLADIASNLSDDGTVLEANGKVEVGFNIMFIKEKALCLPYLKPKKLEPFMSPSASEILHETLYFRALDILEKQKQKFNVR